MAKLISICSMQCEDDNGFYALRDDGQVFRCTMSSIGPEWEQIEGAPNTKDVAQKYTTSCEITDCAENIDSRCKHGLDPKACMHYKYYKSK